MEYKQFPYLCGVLRSFRFRSFGACPWGPHSLPESYAPDPRLLFFTDEAALTWRGKTMERSKSETVEMFVGPAIMVT
jgi:hypothetical protein